MQFELPENVHHLITSLEGHGFEAYAVGGCVRDLLLGKTPKDYDITTNASPQQIEAVFEHHTLLTVGKLHGTIGVYLDGIVYEITTYRVDGDYENHRHPTEIVFSGSLKEDLSRRDFTINGMAYSPQKGLIDYHDGQKDLASKKIRSIGNADERFNEDALRIMRCVRFASVLGFEIEEKTNKAMVKSLPLLDFISAERIREELNKALLGDFFQQTLAQNSTVFYDIIPELQPMEGFQQNTPYHIYDVLEHTLVTISVSPKDLTLRLMMLFHDIGKPHCYRQDDQGIGHFPKHGPVGKEITETILKRLKYSNQQTLEIPQMIGLHNLRLKPDSRVIKRLLRRIGPEVFRKLLVVQDLDAQGKDPLRGGEQREAIAQVQACFESILANNECYSLRQLHITGDDFLTLGVPQGPLVGKLLEQLLELVLDSKVANTDEALLAKATLLIGQLP